jgi:hypothetical protein
MVQKSAVYKQVVKKKGFWNYTELYNYCFDWLKREGYHIVEKEYIEKLSDFGKEILLDWEAHRKVTDYYKNVINVKWHILGMNSAEVERDSKKEKTNKGEVKIVISADLVKDYEARWEDKPLWKFLRGVYDKYIIRTTTEEYEDRLEEKATEYAGDVKAFLEL